MCLSHHYQKNWDGLSLWSVRFVLFCSSFWLSDGNSDSMPLTQSRGRVSGANEQRVAVCEKFTCAEKSMSFGRRSLLPMSLFKKSSRLPREKTETVSEELLNIFPCRYFPLTLAMTKKKKVSNHLNIFNYVNLYLPWLTESHMAAVFNNTGFAEIDISYVKGLLEKLAFKVFSQAAFWREQHSFFYLVHVAQRGAKLLRSAEWRLGGRGTVCLNQSGKPKAFLKIKSLAEFFNLAQAAVSLRFSSELAVYHPGYLH